MSAAKPHKFDCGVLIQTLLVNGYAITSFDHPASETYLIHVRKRDLLGGQALSLLLVASSVGTAIIHRFTKQAAVTGSTPIAISVAGPLSTPQDVTQYSIEEFFDALGGAILTDRVFDTNLPNTMSQLGHNKVPAGFIGKADDLLEAYSKDCIQFLLECPVSRYGQERRFERLPDGLALGRDQMNVYFDAKSYAAEFHPTADDIRRFADYVRSFNKSYSRFVGPIAVFVVVSGSFSSDALAVGEKANALLAECSTPLCMVKAEDLAHSVAMVKTDARRRSAINWRRILLPGIYDISRLKEELNRIRKDGVI